jgi:hypothetical protein
MAPNRIARKNTSGSIQGEKITLRLPPPVWYITTQRQRRKKEPMM